MITKNNIGKRAARLKCIPFCRRDEKNRGSPQREDSLWGGSTVGLSYKAKPLI